MENKHQEAENTREMVLSDKVIRCLYLYMYICI